MTGPDARRVELLARLETALGVRLAGGTAGELADEVASRLGATEVGVSLRETAVALLTKILSDLSGRPEDDVVEDTRIDALLPSMRRRPLWKQLGETLGVELPALERPWPVVLLVALAGIGLMVAALASGQRFWKAFGSAMGTWGLLSLITRTVRLTIPSEVGTVGALADRLVRDHPAVLRPEGAQWSQAQILEVVLAAVRDVYGMEEADATTRLDGEEEADQRTSG